MQRSPTTVLDKAPPATPPKGAAGMVLMGGSAGGCMGGSWGAGGDRWLVVRKRVPGVSCSGLYVF